MAPKRANNQGENTNYTWLVANRFVLTSHWSERRLLYSTSFCVDTDFIHQLLSTFPQGGALNGPKCNRVMGPMGAVGPVEYNMCVYV